MADQKTETTQTFGLPSLSKPTPTWAKNMFRITFLLTTIATFIIGSDSSIPAPLTTKLLIWLKGLDMFIYGLSKMYGIEVKTE